LAEGAPNWCGIVTFVAHLCARGAYVRFVLSCERGQASVEWIALVICVATALGAALALVPLVDGRSLGGSVVHALVCAVRGGCAEADGDRALAQVYGLRDAALVRRYAPSIAYESGTYTLPVDWRICRSHACSDAADSSNLDVHAGTRGGTPATAFTHVVHRGGETFIQYWFYYPDSTTTWGGAAALWGLLDVVGRSTYPGYHADDWEGFQVRVDAAGRSFSRATSHEGYQWCKQPRCQNEWGPWTGWTRVSRGSHAGHVPTVETRRTYGFLHGPHRFTGPVRDRPAVEGVDAHERTTSSDDLRLVPLEAIDPRSYHPLQHDGPTPPWDKKVYGDPLSDSTG